MASSKGQLIRLFVDEVMPRLGDLVLAGEPGVAAARA